MRGRSGCPVPWKPWRGWRSRCRAWSGRCAWWPCRRGVGPVHQQPRWWRARAALVTGCEQPSGSPLATRSPRRTCGSTGSYVVRSPPVCRTDTTPRPASGPAKTTRPGAAARTGVPEGAARSTPRWPGPKRCCGRWKGRSTAGRPGSGQLHALPGNSVGGAASRTAAGDAPAAAQPDRIVARRARTTARTTVWRANAVVPGTVAAGGGESGGWGMPRESGKGEGEARKGEGGCGQLRGCGQLGILTRGDSEMRGVGAYALGAVRLCAD